MTIFDDPAPRIFSSRGDYSLLLIARTIPGEEPTRVYISDPEFYIPGTVHGLLGADHMGADLWTQLVYGTRISLSIGLSAAAISVAVGTAVGIISGYLGGVVDEFIMRIVDVLMAIPDLPILIILGALLGKSVWNIVLLISAFAWMGTARLVRSQTLSLRERVFVEAAKASGASDAYVMIIHILPNVLPLVFAGMVLRIPSAILTEAALSFLGLGDPRVATWGRMLHNARGFGAFTTLAWWWLVPPGLAITFLSLAFVFIGNTVNEILNPRYRERS
jgi:peptide/nickel transport system permease protein